MTYDVLGIGNAIVDVLSMVEEDVIAAHAMQKGGMTLIDEGRAEALYKNMGPATECSGGSVANTLAGLASLGVRCAFIGKVKRDTLGDIFHHDMRAVGVHFDTKPAEEGPATARCLIFVTPDAQRTMNTYIGACAHVSEHDIDDSLIAQSRILYVEGYLWDLPPAKAAIRRALAKAKAAGNKLAFSLSDVFCVDRHRSEFLELIAQVDIVFANEAELASLYQTDDFDKALKRIRKDAKLAAITRHEKGCVIATKEETITVPAEKIANVIDTTGAGDLFASGFLYGISRGWDYAACGALGNRCAGEIIQQIGARSMRPLKELIS